MAAHQHDKAVIFVSKCILDLPVLEALKLLGAMVIRERQDMENHGKDETRGHSRLMHFGMMACCAVMLVPVAGFFIAGGTLSGFWQSLGAFAPLLLCVGAHLMMHKMMGKSCHSETDEGNEQTEVVPAVVSMNQERQKRVLE